MAGGITEMGEPYSPYVGLVYMFNLIVGTGALTMPKAFATAGWAVSLALICILAFMSYMTTTFVIEAMAAANAQLRWKRREQEAVKDSDSSDYSDDEVIVRGRSEPLEARPILSVQRGGSSPDQFDIVERVEMGQMASCSLTKRSPHARGAVAFPGHRVEPSSRARGSAPRDVIGALSDARGGPRVCPRHGWRGAGVDPPGGGRGWGAWPMSRCHPASPEPRTGAEWAEQAARQRGPRGQRAVESPSQTP
ncbi:hypothetical protein COCON_G00211040 [Conger conger]|uniref:Amino acid transporter transmembrane domain-containing protein n=1 Tax=Conger conger TaxID=82655 RepID=A0A9Q1D186_CONCO|nr:hypothetical protein COCON_G00211040 [Conger conger]